jgi:flagellar basal-body rod protein FlgG
MEVSQRIAVSGMLATQRQLDVVSNNIANANATAFKRAVAHTTDTGYQAGLNAPVGPGGMDVRLVGIGEGTQLADINHEFMPGALQATGNPLDIAIQGDAFFNVSLPDGTTGLTRDGAFNLDANGTLVNADGFNVQSSTGGTLTVPAGALSARFDDAGQLIAVDATGTEQIVGSLAVSQVPNKSGLQANGQNVWTATPASGAATPVTLGGANAPVVVAGAIEGSNVDLADEFTRLIQAQRSYQMNSKVVQAWDDIERMANEIHA